MRRKFNLFICFGTLVLLSSCSLFNKVEKEKPKQTVDSKKALDSFLDGVQKDNLSMYGEAILDYQKSLLFDSTTVRAATVYHNLAKDFMLLKKPALALQNSIRAVELDTSTSEIRALLAQLYFENNQFKSAANEYEILVSSRPENQEYLYKLALMYQLTKNLNKALETFQLFIDRFGEDFYVRMEQLKIYDALNDRSKVASILSAMVVNDPSNENLRRTLSREYVSAGKYDSAAVAILPILDTKPDDATTLLSLAEIYFRANNEPLRIKYTSELIKNKEIDDNELMQIGASYLDLGKKDSLSLNFAISFFSEMEKGRPDNWRPKWFLAINFLQKKNNAEALKRLSEVVKAEPSFTEAWQQYALIYLIDNKFKQASTVLNDALKYQPMDYQLNFFKGISEARLNNDSSAVEYLKKANTLNPYAVEPYGELANIYDRQNKHTESDSVYEHILSLDPENHNALNNYAYSLSERNLQLERSKSMSAKSLKYEPKNAAYLDTYGWILYRLKEYDEAVKYIKLSIETGEASQVVHEHLGDIYFELKDFQNAKIWYEKAFQMDISNKRIEAKLNQVK